MRGVGSTFRSAAQALRRAPCWGNQQLAPNQRWYFAARAQKTPIACQDLSSDLASSILELALVSPLLLLLLAGAVDLGRAFYAAIEVSSAASAGALYGTQNPSDTAGMQKAALLDGADLNGLTAVATWGCECPNGSSASASCASTPSCSGTPVNYVQVSTTMTYTPLLNYPGIPSSIPLAARARMRASQ